MEALKAGDRPAYEGANKLANEAFGKSFYSQVALSATFRWPIFFALGWMQYRFLDMTFPLPFIGFSLGYIGVFIILYAAAYFVFKPVKRRMPYFRRLKELKDASGRSARNLKSCGDPLLPAAAANPPGPAPAKRVRCHDPPPSSWLYQARMAWPRQAGAGGPGQFIYNYLYINNILVKYH